MNEGKLVRRVSVIGICGNVLLSAFKFYAGTAGHSAAMISDAIHSLSDVLATLIAYIGVKISKKGPDREHPYGHDRMECIASLALGIILIAAGAGIGYGGVKDIIDFVRGSYNETVFPSMIALVAAVVSIAVKEGMFWYTRSVAKKLNSQAFMADAWHHRSDALSSVGSFIGIGGSMLGIRILEPAASVAICACIFKVAIDIIKNALSNTLDTACSPELEREMSEFISGLPGVSGLDKLQTRMFGSGVYVEAEISVRGDMSLEAAHEIAENVHDAVEKKYPDVKHIMIHENPYNGYIRKKDAMPV